MTPQIALLVLAVVLFASGFVALDDNEDSWAILAFLACALAVIAALLVGDAS